MSSAKTRRKRLKGRTKRPPQQVPLGDLSQDFGLSCTGERVIGWQPAETAPRDGTKVRLANAFWGNVEAHWDGRDWVVEDHIWTGSRSYPAMYAWAPAYAVNLPPPRFREGGDGRLEAVLGA